MSFEGFSVMKAMLTTLTLYFGVICNKYKQSRLMTEQEKDQQVLQ